MAAVAVVVAVIAVLAWYRRDIRRHPRVRCLRCTGTGDHGSRIGGGRFRRPFGDCWYCGGRKSRPRLAARLLDPAGYREEKRKIAQGRAKI